MAFIPRPGYSRLSAGAEEDLKAVARSRFPLGRSGDVKDISNAAIFLFSPVAEWITGQIIV